MSAAEGEETPAEYARRKRPNKTVEDLAGRLNANKRTISNWLKGKSAPSGGRVLNPERSIEAGLAWHSLTGELPTSFKWNPTLTRASSPENYARCLRGWASTDEARRRKHPVESWPSPQSIAAEFGGFNEYREVLKDEIRNRRDAGQEYRPAGLPEIHVTDSELQAAYVRDLDPDHPEHKRSLKGVGPGFRAPHPDLLLDVVNDGERPATFENRKMPGHFPKVMDARHTVAVATAQDQSNAEQMARMVASDLMENGGPVYLIETAASEISEHLDAHFKKVEMQVRMEGRACFVDLPILDHGEFGVISTDSQFERQATLHFFKEFMLEIDRSVGSVFVSHAGDLINDILWTMEALDEKPFVAITFSWEPKRNDLDIDAMVKSHFFVPGQTDDKEAYEAINIAKEWIYKNRPEGLKQVAVGMLPGVNLLQHLRDAGDLTTRDVNPSSVPHLDRWEPRDVETDD